jgi:hypothetical protein
MLGKHEFSEIRIENRLAEPIDNKKIMIFLYFNIQVIKKKEVFYKKQVALQPYK